MNKNSLVHRVAESSQCPILLCEKIIDNLIKECKDALVQGDSISLPGLAVLETINRQERKGYSIKDKKVVTYPSTKTLRCRFSKALKDEVKLKG